MFAFLLLDPTLYVMVRSVGCTIVELLTGKPPYYDLAPMAALFRIVQDDYPPLPSGISEVHLMQRVANQ